MREGAGRDGRRIEVKASGGEASGRNCVYHESELAPRPANEVELEE